MANVRIIEFNKFLTQQTNPVAYLGFPRGGANLLFAKFSPKLHENEELWTLKRSIFYYVDPPLEQSTVSHSVFFKFPQSFYLFGFFANNSHVWPVSWVAKLFVGKIKRQHPTQIPISTKCRLYVVKWRICIMKM